MEMSATFACRKFFRFLSYEFRMFAINKTFRSAMAGKFLFFSSSVFRF